MSLPTRLFKLDAATVHKAFLNPKSFDFEKVPLGKVVNTAQLPPTALTGINYCSVSHVWGSKVIKFTVANVPWQVPISSKEKLIFVLEACKRRGYVYVWMDVFCINQDNKEDSKVEMTKMKDYYQNSSATIVIGDDWQIFAARWNKVQAAIWDWNGNLDKLIDKDWDGLQQIDDLVQDQWFHRVWTLQEAVIPSITRPLDANPAPYSPSRLLTADGDVLDTRGLCELIDWTYIALGKLSRDAQSKYQWVHPGQGVVNDKGWEGVMKLNDATRHGISELHPIQAFMLTLDRNTSYPIDKLRGFYALIDLSWQSMKDDLHEACKEIAEKYIVRKEGALLLSMDVTTKDDMTWAAAVFRYDDLQFGNFVPDGERYVLNSAIIMDKTILKLTVAGCSKITVLDHVFGDGSGELAGLVETLIELDKMSFNISSIVSLLRSVVYRAQLASELKTGDIYDIQKALSTQGNAISSSLRATFAGWWRRIVVVKNVAFLAWQPLFDQAVSYSLLWVSSGLDEWAMIVGGDVKNGCKKVGIAYVGGLNPVEALPPISPTEVKIL